VAITEKKRKTNKKSISKELSGFGGDIFLPVIFDGSYACNKMI
jgi:hypothetical protein